MSEFFAARYRIVCSKDAVRARAHALALEQSVELPLAGIRDPAIRDRIAARVEAVTVVETGGAAPPADGDLASQEFEVTLALATATTALDPSQLLNMLFGNCSLQPEVSLVDVEIPRSIAGAMGGPRFGIAGIRTVTGVPERAITCCALKPQGLSPPRMAGLAAELARGGVDLIKDDHGIADQAYAPFAERVPLIQRAIDRVNRDTGGRAVYAPTLSGPPSRLAEQARIIAAEGVGMALACPALMGYSCFAELVQERLTVPVIAHPALAGGRIAPPLLLGKLFRLFGADAVIFPNHGGRFCWTPAQCLAVAEAARAPMHGLAPAMPVAAGGMRIDRAEEMLAFYGPDVMLLIGGDVLVGDDVEARARAFVSTVERGAGVCSPTAERSTRESIAPSTASSPLAGSHQRGMAAQPRRAYLGAGRWETVDVLRYKPDDTLPEPSREVTRQVLFDDPSIGAQLRYFEVAPGGWSTLERHEHAHAVLILRGRGRCLVGNSVMEVAEHDLVTVPPMTWHQFRSAPDAALGFLCLVNRDRDRPQLPTGEELRAMRADPVVSEFIG